MNMVIDFYLFLVEEQRGHCTVKDKKKGVQKDRSLLFLKKLFVDQGVYSIVSNSLAESICCYTTHIIETFIMKTLVI